MFFFYLSSSHEQKKKKSPPSSSQTVWMYLLLQSQLIRVAYIHNQWFPLQNYTLTHTRTRARALNCCIEFARYCKYAPVIFDHDHHHHHSVLLCSTSAHTSYLLSGALAISKGWERVVHAMLCVLRCDVRTQTIQFNFVVIFFLFICKMTPLICIDAHTVNFVVFFIRCSLAFSLLAAALSSRLCASQKKVHFCVEKSSIVYN